MYKFVMPAVMVAFLAVPFCFASTDHNAGIPLDEVEFIVQTPVKKSKMADTAPVDAANAPVFNPLAVPELGFAPADKKMAVAGQPQIWRNNRVEPTNVTPRETKAFVDQQDYRTQAKFVVAAPDRNALENISPPQQDTAAIIKARAVKISSASEPYGAPALDVAATVNVAATTAPGATSGLANISTSGLVGYGSGFFITPNIVVTNFHVVKGLSNMMLLHLDTPMHAVLIAKDEPNDLALLKVTGYNSESKVNPLPISDIRRVNVGEKVYAVGFPDPKRLGFRPKITDGLISSIAGEHDNPNCFQISAPVQPGSSGGPLLNNKGQVVGIVTKRWNNKNYQNVSYAVKSNHLINLLLSLPEGIIIPEDPVFDTPVDGQDIMLLARDAVVTIVRRKN